MVNVSRQKKGGRAPPGGFSEVNKERTKIFERATAGLERQPFESDAEFFVRRDLVGFQAAASSSNPTIRNQALGNIPIFQSRLAEFETKRKAEFEVAQRQQREQFQSAVSTEVAKQISLIRPERTEIILPTAQPVTEFKIAERQPSLTQISTESKIGIGAGAVALLAIVALGLSRGK